VSRTINLSVLLSIFANKVTVTPRKFELSGLAVICTSAGTMRTSSLILSLHPLASVPTTWITGRAYRTNNNRIISRSGAGA
jgi:hypothetical protein